MPGKRAALFLQNELQKELKSAYLAPEIISFGEWIEGQSDLVSIDPTVALCHLYPIYDAKSPGKESFDQFLTWGKQLINDWNEIGRYMLDDKTVYQNLKDIQQLENWEIDDWSFSQSPLTKRQKSFLDLWDNILEIKTAFQAKIHAEGLSLSGEIYRNCANNIENIANRIKPKHLYIAGLNALSSSEEKILDVLIKRGKANVYWDIDWHYLKDHQHEAGFFLRQHYAKWKNQCSWIEGEWEKSKKEINIFEAPNEHAQVAVLNKILQNSSNYTLVMPDDALLLPSLLEMPDQVKDVNITKQWPLHQSSFYHLISKILKLWDKGIKVTGLHFSQLDEFCSLDANSHLLSDNEINKLNKFRQIVSEKNIPFISKDQIISKLSGKIELLDTIFSSPSSTEVGLKKIINLLSKSVIDTDSKLAKVLEEQLFQCKKILDKLIQFIKEHKLEINFGTAHRLFDSFAKNSDLNFIGEPLNGLQIIGVLETRAIDYDNLIILNTNEGVLPAKANTNSLIPYDLRRYFGLPLQKEKESIYAYYFYRLLSRCKSAHLIHHSHTEGLSSGELSRYLLQLKLSYSEQKNLQINTIENNFKVSENTYPSEIIKSDRIIELSKKFLQSGLSPSALGNFMECQENFYHNNLLRIYEINKNEELIEDSTYGSIIHQTLDELYKRKIESDPKINIHTINDLRQELSSELEKQFLIKFESRELQQSLISVKYEMAKKALLAFLDLEEQEIKNSQNGFIEILKLESTFFKSLSFKYNDEIVEFNLKGTIDRIDKIDGVHRILDYKSGKVKTKDLNFKSLEGILENKDNKKIVQVLFYASLLEKEYSNAKTAMCSLATLNPKWTYLHHKESEILVSKELIASFDELMISWAKNLMNKEIPLYSTSLASRFSDRIKLIREN